jgi:hypothetical protein
MALLVSASTVALAFTGSALAAYTPRLIVNHGTLRPTATGSTTIKIQQTKEENATAKITIYAPTGYSATLTQAPGTQIGTVSANVQATQIGNDVVIPLTGTVKVGDNAQTAQAATACTGSPTHAAVWLLSLVAANQPPLNVPVYVDATSGQEAALGAYKLQTCFSTPATTSFGAKLVNATFTVNEIFNLPATRGQFVWSALFTPYATNSGPANPAGTVESRAYVRIGAQLTLNKKIANKRKKVVALYGTLGEFTFAIRGTTVQLFIGNAKRASFTTKTVAGGRYAFVLRNKSKKVTTTTFHARAVVPDRDITSTGCAGTSIAPGGCVSATIGGFTVLSNTVRVRL